MRLFPSLNLAATAVCALAFASPPTGAVTPVVPPPIEAPQPYPVGDHVVATTTLVLRPLTGVYAPPPPPAVVSVLPATSVTFSLPVPAGEIATVRWYRDNRLLAATTPTLTLSSTTVDDDGFYTAVITRPDDPPVLPAYAGRFETIRLRIGSPDDHRLLNLSARATLGPANPTMIAGFVVAPRAASPTAAKAVLLRAVGPSLAKFGVSAPLARPRLKIFQQDGSEYRAYYAFTMDRPYFDLVADATTRTGAFPLLNGAADAAEVRPMIPGIYTIHVTSEEGGTGDVLLEIYEVPESPWPPAPNPWVQPVPIESPESLPTVLTPPL